MGSKRKKATRRSPVLGLLTGFQIEQLIESLGRARFAETGRPPDEEQVTKVMEWATNVIADNALLKAVLMGGLEIDVDDKGEITFVSAIVQTGFVAYDSGVLH